MPSEQGTSPQETIQQQVQNLSSDRAYKEAALLRVWRGIEEYLRELAQSDYGGVVPISAFEGRRLAMIRNWAKIFWSEIESVRLARNSVALVSELSDANLDTAVELGERLLEIIDSHLK